MAGLRMTPAEREEMKRRNNLEMAKKGAEEAARYAALSDADKRQYDVLTEGMMPRLCK